MVNPYQRHPFGPAHDVVEMGRQSQQRVNQTKRAYQLASKSKSNNKRKGDQLTLDGQRAFQAERDCIVCKARALKRYIIDAATTPKRAHHVLCSLNKKTRGAGNISQATATSQAEEKRLKAHFSQPLSQQEKCHGKYATKEAGLTFFSVRKPAATTTTTARADCETMPKATTMTTTINFCKEVSATVADPSFQEKHKSKSAPLAMIAFAGAVDIKVIKAQDKSIFDHCFSGMTMVVPPSVEATNEPHYCWRTTHVRYSHMERRIHD